MSIKTLRKRIALVAVSALGVGLLSVAPASAAASNTFEDNTLFIADNTSGSGNAAATYDIADTNAFSSVGWVTDTRATSLTSTGALYETGGATATGVALSGAKLAFAATGDASTETNGLSIVVTGGTLSSVVATSSTTVTLGSTTAASYAAINGSATTFTMDAGTASKDAGNAVAGVFTLNGAVGSVATISLYTGANIVSLATATSGTLQAQWQITIAAASSSNAYSAADSSIYQQACMAVATTGTSGTNAYDTTSTCANGQVGVVYVDLEDAYGAALTSGTLTAASSAGVITYSDASTTGSVINGATTGFSTVTIGSDTTDVNLWFYVKQPTANTNSSTTVTISLNGAVLATKTIKWFGDVATLTVDTTNSCANFSVGQSSDTTESNIGAGCVVYVAKDATGAAVTWSTQPSVYAATGALVGSTLSTTTASTGYGVTQTASTGYGYSTLLIPANSLSGAGAYQLYLTNAAGATIKSQEVKVTVSRGSAYTFTASWDKAVYAPGDIATLTIAAKDAYGNPMADGTTLAGLDIITNSTNVTSVGTACSTSSAFVGGVKTCKFAMGNTEGGYGYSVKLTTGSLQSPITGTVSIKGATVVSNAEVLAAIVKLIASINKQIKALQKQLKK